MNSGRKILFALLAAAVSVMAAAQEPIPVVKAPRLAISSALPASVDNSTLKYFPPLLSQVGGSCAQASYIGYMYTYEMNRYMDRDASASSEYRYAYLYTYNFINDGQDNGSYGYDGLQLTMANGVMSEKDFPRQSYTSSYYWASGYEKYYRAMHNRLQSFQRMELENEDQLQQVKQYLFNHGEEGKAGGVVTFATYASNWQMEEEYDGPSETGYKSLLTQLGTTGGHALTIVGYDDLVEFTAPDGTASKGAFIVVNTWGKWYHDNGRYYLPYWFFLNEQDSKYYLNKEVCALDVAYKQPSITFKVGIDCDARNNISFFTGAAEGLVAESPVTINYKVQIANHMGGPYKMQGQYADSDIEFGFDFTSAAKFLEGMDDLSYFLTVTRLPKDGKKASFAKLTSFAVYDYRENPTAPKVYEYEVPEGGIDLREGNNVFSVTTGEPPVVSCSNVPWIAASGNPSTSPLIFKTADGRYAKVRFSDYDRESGTIRIKYVYAPNGKRNLSE